ncbi:hypothetical protein HNH97_06350, partial [Gluconacetobacter entanii]|nr:hypothetical protein [Gluconacetobacter entanii]
MAGTPARSAAELVGVNRNTATLYYRKLREIIAEQIAHEAPVSGEIEVDESYFGGHRKGKRGRGAAGKVAVFGLLKRHGRVHAVMIPNAGHQTLMSIIRKKVQPDFNRLQRFLARLRQTGCLGISSRTHRSQ